MVGIVKIDLKAEVQRFENLNAPVLEYNFARKNFIRPVNSTTGIYSQPTSGRLQFNGDGEPAYFQDKTPFEFN